MKYLSLVLLLFCLGFTWHLAHVQDPISLKVHRELQQAVSEVIKAAVTQQLPSATDFAFTRLYTQTIDENSVKTYFVYSFNEAGADATEREVQGQALLTRDPAEKGKWILDDIRVDQAAIEF
ncbi:MAG: hypothetical protein ABL958_04945, partial [Bdellovibrionia bacterium]